MIYTIFRIRKTKMLGFIPSTVTEALEDDWRRECSLADTEALADGKVPMLETARRFHVQLHQAIADACDHRAFQVIGPSWSEFRDQELPGVTKEREDFLASGRPFEKA